MNTEENNISKRINKQDREACDALCRELLSNKAVLARILKECTDEFKNIDPNEIAEKYIEPNPMIGGEIGNESEAEKSIHGMKNEEKSLEDGTIVYDIRFRAIVPGTEKEKIELIINVEVQNRDNPGYPLIKRGIYYGARLISSQKGEEFVKSRYQDIKKVYSIWVCTNVSKEKKNTITKYAIREENIIGEVHEKKENYDLMDIVMVGMGEENDRNYRGIFELLDLLIKSRKPAEERKEKLKNIGIPMTEKLEEDVIRMCNVSYGIYEEGINYGKEEGRREGRKEGIDRGQIKMVRNLAKSMNITFEKSMELLNIPEEDRERYARLLKQN